MNWFHLIQMKFWFRHALIQRWSLEEYVARRHLMLVFECRCFVIISRYLYTKLI